MINSTTFNRCERGISLGSPIAGVDTKINLFKFEGNTFSCSSPINGTTNGVTEVGVHLTTLFGSVDFGSIGGSENLFTGIHTGIHSANYPGVSFASQSVFNVYNGVFDKNLEHGIWAETLAEFEVINSDFINNGTHGILAETPYQFLVEECTFIYNDAAVQNNVNDLYYGIRFNPAGWTLNDQFEIKNNEFLVDFNQAGREESVECVSMYGGDSYWIGGYDISSNVFDMQFRKTITNAPTNAISFDGGTHILASGQIYDNDITFDNSFAASNTTAAINIVNGDYSNLDINYNIFREGSVCGFMAGSTMASNGEIGINLQGSIGEGNSIRNNTWEDRLEAMESTCYLQGINAENFSNTEYTSNFIQECENPMFYTMDCENSTLLCNTMKGGRVHLTLNSAVIGLQGGFDNNGNLLTHGNKWFDVEQPQRHASCDLNLTHLSEFYVNGSQGGGNPEFPAIIYPAIIYPSNTWFTGGGSDENCTPAESLTLEEEIATGSTAAALANPIRQWNMEYYLLNRLYNNSELLNQSSILSDFYTDNLTTSLGALVTVSRSLSDAFISSSTLQSQITLVQNELETLLASAKALDAEISTFETYVPNHPTLLDRANIQEDIGLKMQEKALLIEEYNNSVSSKLEVLEDELNTVSVSSIPEVNLKLVLEAKIEYALEGGLANSTHSNLTALAAQCPQEAGLAVYSARAFMPDCSFVDQDCASQVEGREIDKIVEYKFATVFPNPNNGTFSIQVDNSIEGECHLFDALGRLVTRQLLQNGVSTFGENTHLDSGVYFAKVITSSGALNPIQIIIQK